MDDLLKIDLYKLLNISITADENEIKKAYRKKALSCHPDKNPDNPKAGELFQQLSEALGVLTDSAARAAYDKALRAKKAAEIRHKELGSQRKKLKEDLEAREKNSQDIEPDELLKREIERLRKEGFKHLEEAQRLLQEELEKERLASIINPPSSQASRPRPKVDDSSVLTSRDYESVVLMKLRQAEERKRLIQQMQDEDA